MIAAVSGYGDTSHSAAQPLRLRFDLPVAIGQVSNEADRIKLRVELASHE